MLNGRLGQVKGPFEAEIDLLSSQGAIGQFTPETTKPILYKLGIQSQVGTNVLINGVPVTIGKTGIYELDNIVEVYSLKFPEGGTSDTIIDFVY